MKSPIERIKADITDNRQRGMRDKLMVDARALIDLVYDYERMDASERAFAAEGNDINLLYRLEILITAIFYMKREPAVCILNVLQPTIEKLAKEQDDIRRVQARIHP